VRLLYDLRLLDGTVHGMARYALGLLDGLLATQDNLEVTALVRGRAGAAQAPDDPRVKLVRCGPAPYGVAGRFFTPRAAKQATADIYHCPFFAPLPRPGRPMVITIHDLIHLRFPRDYKLRHRVFYRRFLGPVARRAPLILTVSKHSKRDLAELLGVSPRRIVVTPNGVDRRFRPLDPLTRDSAAQRLGLPADYILGVGNPKPHKNLGALLRAHAELAQRTACGGGRVPPLVILGASARDLARHHPGDSVIFLRNLGDEDIPLLYGAAEMVVVPSLYEGFGLPALEALAAGVPLVASNRSSLPEVVGKAGVLIDPTPAKLAAAMARVHSDQELRLALTQAGPRRAAEFSWENTARATWEAYQRVLSEGGRP